MGNARNQIHSSKRMPTRVATPSPWADMLVLFQECKPTACQGKYVSTSDQLYRSAVGPAVLTISARSTPDYDQPLFAPYPAQAEQRRHVIGTQASVPGLLSLAADVPADRATSSAAETAAPPKLAWFVAHAADPQSPLTSTPSAIVLEDHDGRLSACLDDSRSGRIRISRSHYAIVG